MKQTSKKCCVRYWKFVGIFFLGVGVSPAFKTHIPQTWVPGFVIPLWLLILAACAWGDSGKSSGTWFLPHGRSELSSWLLTLQSTHHPDVSCTHLPACLLSVCLFLLVNPSAGSWVSGLFAVQSNGWHMFTWLMAVSGPSGGYADWPKVISSPHGTGANLHCFEL